MMRMKVFAVLVLPVLAWLAGAGCAADFYDDSRNWVVRNSEIPAYSTEYDVFFLYPSQIETSVDTLNWTHGGLSENIRRYVLSMTMNLDSGRTRVFSPFVPQLGFKEYRRLLETRAKDPERFDFFDSPLAPAIRHTVLALKYYLKHYNPDDRPFVLIGQEQGAVLLYEAMKHVSSISVKNGFAAAYLQGMPGVTAKTILRDFGSRGIRPASGPYDFGVIAVFNTRLPGEKGDPVADACVINPLNWCTDATPAKPQQNPVSVFYLRKAGKTRTIPHFCGAAADPGKGVVFLTDLPPKSGKELRESVFPSEVWGIFSGSIGLNAEERIHEYIFRQELRSAK